MQEEGEVNVPTDLNKFVAALCTLKNGDGLSLDSLIEMLTMATSGAYQRGFDEGYAAGYEKGRREGYHQGSDDCDAVWKGES